MLGSDNKRLKMDIACFWMLFKGIPPKSYIFSFYYLMCGIREFRNVFYMHVEYLSLLFQYFLLPMVELSFATPSRYVGGNMVGLL